MTMAADGNRPTDGSSPPVLVAASHGTSDSAGQRAVAGLVAAVRAALPEVDVRDAFVDVQEPSAADLVNQLAPDPVVVVPLLLSAGYHVYVDLAQATSTRPGVVRAGALGPDRRLTLIAAGRLRDAAASAGECLTHSTSRTDATQQVRVVLAAAGSSDRRAVVDCARAAEDLAGEVGCPVTAAYLSAARPTVEEAVSGIRTEHPHAVILVASYLLAPGYFQDLLVRRASEAGADVITAPLLQPDAAPDPRLVELVVDRYRARVNDQQVPVPRPQGVD